jgi:hypothetical protein
MIQRIDMSVDVDDMLPMGQILSDKMEGILRKSGELATKPPAAYPPPTMQKLALGAVQQIVACCHQQGYPIDDFLRSLLKP